MRKLISLGVRCDVAFQLRMHSGDNTSHFFDWLALDASAAINIIENNFNVFAPDNLKLLAVGDGRNHIEDALTKTQFHHHFPMIDGSVISDYLTYYTQFIGKFDYLADRFRTYVREYPITFVRRKITSKEAARLEQVFYLNFPEADAQFVYINNGGEVFLTEHGKSYILPESNYTMGDPEVWANFLIDNRLVDTPFRISAKQILGKAREGHGLSPNNRFKIEHLTKAIEYNPSNTDYFFEIVDLYRRRGDIENAIQYLEKILKTGANPQDVAIEKIVTLKQGKLISETQFMVDGVALQDKEARLAGALAYSFYNAGKYIEAIHYFSIHLKAHPLDDLAMLFKALSLRNLQRFEEADRTVCASIDLNPKRSRSRLLKSMLLRRNGRAEEALFEATTAAQLDPSRIDCKFFLATLMEEQNRFSDAKKIYEELLTTGDGAAGAQQRLEALILKMPAISASTRNRRPKSRSKRGRG